MNICKMWLKNQIKSRKLVCHSNHDATYLDCGFGAWVSRATFIHIFEINRWTCLFLFLCAGRQWSQLVFSVQAVASPARQRSLRDPWTAGWRKPWTSCGQKVIPSLASKNLLHSLHKIEYHCSREIHLSFCSYDVQLQSLSLCLFAERDQSVCRKISLSLCFIFITLQNVSNLSAAKANVLGGEVALWTEQADAASMMSRCWTSSSSFSTSS